MFELLTFEARTQPDHKSTRVPFRKRRKDLAVTLTNHETQWLLLANALTPREYILDLYTLLNMLPARSFPGYHRTGPARKVPLRKDIIRDMRQALKAFHLWQIEADTLRSGMGTRAVQVLIMHPNGRGDVRYTSDHVLALTYSRGKGIINCLTYR